MAGPPNACRIRVPADGDIARTMGALRDVCAQHAGGVPLFLHVQVPLLEVVVRAGGVSVDASSAMTEKIEALLGPGTVTVEHAGRA